MIYLNYGFEHRPVERSDPIEVLYRWDGTDTISAEAPAEPVDAHAEPVQPVPALPAPITTLELP